ncbi:MAG TPA: phenylalanine--tRNA ligase subunit beta, partial [Bacillota bacterium]|nr:phenylalanine--tRNA ligase subunit beta [Bacillota bacterium]
VMGGENTEINPRTRTVLLEAAMFNPSSIRRTARRFNLPSEASQRFERGVNPGATLAAQNRAALLLARHAGGQVMKGVVDTDPAPPEPRRITVRPHRINEILGVKIPVAEVTEILTRLDFDVARGSGGILELTVPLHRGDVLIEEDVVEEVARIYGYERIPLTLPRGELLSSRETTRQQIHTLVRQSLVSCGFFEAITLSFINPAHLESLRLEEDDPRRQAIALQNPLSEEQGIMRTTLLPGLFKVLQHNFNYREMNQLFFEIGAVFLPRRLPLDELPHEPQRLALAATGQFPDPNWLTAPSPADFYLVKGALELLCSRLHISGMGLVPAALPFLHPTRSAGVIINGAEIGFIGQVHPEVAETWDFRQPVTVCELDLDALVEAAALVPRLAPLPRYPAAWRDLAVVVSRDLAAGELERRIREAGGELLDRVTLFDLYEGEQVPPGKRSLAFSLTFRRPEGTLTDEEVQAALARVERALEQMGASLRR